MGPHLFVLASPVLGSPVLGSPVLGSLVLRCYPSSFALLITVGAHPRWDPPALGSPVLGSPVLVTSTCITLGLLVSPVTLKPYLFWGRRRN